MTLPEQIDYIFTNIESKGIRGVSRQNLKYIYKEVFGKEFKENCGVCFDDAYYELLKFRKKNKDKQPTVSPLAIHADIENLKQMLPKFEAAGKFIICEWIKNRIEFKQKLV